MLHIWYKCQLWTYLGTAETVTANSISWGLNLHVFGLLKDRQHLKETQQADKLRGRPHEKRSFAKNAHVLLHFGWPSTRILKMQRLKKHFFATGLRVEKSEKAALPFCAQRIRILSERMMPSPHPLTSCLQPLNPATSCYNNNNNGGLHACVRATEDIEPFLQRTCLVVECESQQQFDLIIGPHKQFWFPCTSHFRLLLVVFGFSFYCPFVYSTHSLSLLPRFWRIEYELQRFLMFSVYPYGRKYSWNDAEEDGGKKDHFHTCGRALSGFGPG